MHGSGATIHERGITPHVEVVMTPEEDSKLDRQRARADLTDAAAFKERFGFELTELTSASQVVTRGL